MALLHVLGVRRLYVAIRPFVNIVGPFLQFMALRLYRICGLRVFILAGSHHILIVPVNIAGAAFLTLITESFLS